MCIYTYIHTYPSYYCFSEKATLYKVQKKAKESSKKRQEIKRTGNLIKTRLLFKTNPFFILYYEISSSLSPSLVNRLLRYRISFL